MTTKTEMTLENEFKSFYNNPENIGTVHWFNTIIANAKHCAEFIRLTEKESVLTVELKKEYAKKIEDCFRDLLKAQKNGLIELHQISAPESQAHLLTEKDRHELEYSIYSTKVTWCPICKEHFYIPESFHIVESKLASQPPVMEGKEEKITYQTTLTDKELINLCDEWVSKMCKTGGKAFTMSVPVRLNYDTDVVLSALINRFSLANKTIQSLQSEVEQLKGLLKEAQPFCGTMLRGKIEHYTSK